MTLAKQILTVSPCQGELAVYWLGQAGFILKDSMGRLIAIDPYLSDSVERLHGFKRLSPKLLSPRDLTLDLLICSHEHGDHYDCDAVPALMSEGKTVLITNPSAAAMAVSTGIPDTRIRTARPGDDITEAGIRLQIHYADHGELSPDAFGVLLETGGVKVYFAGDTSLHPEVLKTAEREQPDILIAPINGQFGNINEKEAAQLAAVCRSASVIPCHFWTFTEHKGDPEAFREHMQSTAPNAHIQWFCHGEGGIYRKESNDWITIE